MNFRKNFFIKSIKYIVKHFLYTIIYFYKTNSDIKIKNHEQYAKVILDENIMTEDRGRYFYILIKYLMGAGFKVIIYTEKSFFLKMNRYSKLLLNENLIFQKRKIQSTNTISIEKLNHFYKQIKFDYSNKKYLKNIDFVAPYPMHPNQVRKYVPSFIKKLRTSNRPIKIFFAGNIDERMYSRKALEVEYNIITRYECINFIINTFQNKHLLELITKRDKLYSLLTTEIKYTKIVISNVKTEEKDWLKFLSISDFFIALPGVEHPWCHNSIEAMAVGTIPILQYSNLFDPPLQPMVNCLYYSNVDELGKMIHLALNMEEAQINVMRENVITYFENYLSPATIINKLQSIPLDEKEEYKIAIPFLKHKKPKIK